MPEQSSTRSALIHRSTILDGICALYVAQQKFDRFLKEDQYTCGYREGFEDALLSLAQMVGVLDEFEATRQKFHSFEVNNLPIYSANQNETK
jgi:hypothetical protein